MSDLRAAHSDALSSSSFSFASADTNAPLSTEPGRFVTATVATRLGLRRGILTTLGLSLAVNVLLALHIATCRPVVTTVLLPPSGEAFSVTDGKADRVYLERMALSLTESFSTLTPSTALKRLLSVLPYASPESHAALEAQMRREAKALVTQNASIVFFPEKISVEEESMCVSVLGHTKTLIGSDVTSDVRTVWRYRFRVTAGRLEIVTLSRESGALAGTDRAVPVTLLGEENEVPGISDRNLSRS